MQSGPQLIERFYVRVALVLGVWTVFGLFFGTQEYVRDIYFGKTPSYAGYLIGWIICGYSWAILTVPVLWFARRFAWSRLKYVWFFPVHILAGAGFALIQLGLYVAIASIPFNRGWRNVGELYKYLLANEFQSSFLVYFTIIAAVYAY